MTTKTVTKKVQVFIPFEEFRLLYDALPMSRVCKAKWCPYSRTTCHVREIKEKIREWWTRNNGSAPGFASYELALQNCIKTENRLYWAFWTEGMQECRACYDELVAQVRAAFEKKPLDTRGHIHAGSAWPRSRN